MSLTQGQIYKGTAGSYSAISSPFEYIPLPQSHVVNRSGSPISGAQASETLDSWLYPGDITADGSFITSDEWLNYSTWSTDDWQSSSDMKRAFSGASRPEPNNGDGLFTRNTLGAVALQGQNDSNYWSHSFAQGLSAVQNGQFTFMVGSDRDVAPGQTNNGLSNTLVTKRFKLVAGQTDMSSSASVTLVAYNSGTHPADWDSQWVLSTDGSQLTYYAGTNSSTNFEDLNSNINNASTKLPKAKIYQGDSSSYSPIDAPLEILARVGPGTNGSSDILNTSQLNSQSWYEGEGSWQSGRYGNTNDSQFHDPFAAVTQGLYPQGPFGVINNTDDVTGDPILTQYKDFFIARKTNGHWLIEYSIASKDYATPKTNMGMIRLTFKLTNGQTAIDTSSWVEGQATPITVDVVPIGSNPSDWANNWVLNAAGTTLTYYSDDASGTTGLAPLSIDSFELGDINNAVDPVTDGGTGYPNGGTDVATTGGSGTGMTVDFTATSGVISDVTINNQGINYKSGDQVKVDGGNTPATFTLSADSPQSSPQSLLGQNVNGRTMVVESATGVFGTNSMKDSVISVESDMYLVVDSLVYQQKVNYSHEQIPSNASMVYPSVNNISEYEVINLGSDALNYSDTNVNVTLSGFYAV